MNKLSFQILRIAIAITFIWIGTMIFGQPEAWGGYIQPWALDLLPIPLRELMLATAILDMAIGAFLLLNRLTWIAALIGALHIVTVLITSGINEGTVRDIGVLGGIIAIFLNSLPQNVADRIKSFGKRKQ